MKIEPIPQIHDLMNDRQCFNSFVYTDIPTAVAQLEARRLNADIERYVQDQLPEGLPPVFKNEKNAVLARQLASPNFEFMQFSSVVEQLKGFNKVTLEMHQDKFTPSDNLTKYHLAKMVFDNACMGKGRERSLMTVDFNEYGGKRISEVKTLWGQDFIEFHKELMQFSFNNRTNVDTAFFESSEWVSGLGRSADQFYPKFLSMFLQNGILFENFLLKEKAESTFTKEVFLPAFIRIIQETGIKPLIVSYLPVETEGCSTWNYYPAAFYNFVNNKLQKSRALERSIAA